ncbi:MAG: DUF1800 family protein [Acidobacteria bacterium]|nr:DUF1800 family protein [Acidobacteriota bacterium]
MQQRMRHGWYGARRPALALPPGLLLADAPRRRITIPNALRSDVAAMATAARAAGNGNSPAAQAAVSQAEALLLERSTLGPTVADHDHIDQIGYEGWLEEQLDFASLDDSALEDSLHGGLPTLSMSAQQLWRQYSDNPFVPIFELWVATFYRALYSPRQLFERMSIFWSDHFSIDVFGDFMQVLKPVDDRSVVRANALGSFPQMLAASAHSPAMLSYLTNDTNEKNHPNENYARELLELHTMGADRGYTEKDVKEVARCLTGWNWRNPYSQTNGEIGTFAFFAYMHDNGTKRVLGKSIPAGGGIADGERVVDILAKRKETSEYIATKMLRWLHGYEPSKKLVKSVAKTYRRTNGDIRAMVRKALREKTIGTATPKLKRPFHLVISALRALAADVDDAAPMLDHLGDAGHLPFSWTPPNGYPDRSEWWSSLLVPRWNFAQSAVFDDAVSLDPALDDPSGSPASIVKRIDRVLMHGRMGAETRKTLETMLAKRRSRERVREALATAISAPEFQEY